MGQHAYPYTDTASLIKSYYYYLKTCVFYSTVYESIVECYIDDGLSEWLRSLTRNQVCVVLTGSNPVTVVIFYYKYFIVISLNKSLEVRWT